MGIQHLFIREINHGLFYVDNNDQMCFQRSVDLHKTPTEHIFYLRLECKGKPEADYYYWNVSYELDKKGDELACDDFKWIKPKIISDVENVCIEDIIE